MSHPRTSASSANASAIPDPIVHVVSPLGVDDPALAVAALELRFAEALAERDALRLERDELRSEVLRLPEELAAVANSRAFRVISAAPFLAMRQPLSTMLVIGGMGLLTNIWSFTPVASALYIGVGAIVLAATAVQFWASHD